MYTDLAGVFLVAKERQHNPHFFSSPSIPSFKTQEHPGTKAELIGFGQDILTAQQEKIFPEPQRGLNAAARLFTKGTAQPALSHAEARSSPTDSDEEPFFQTHIHNVRAGAEQLCSPAELAARLNRILCETSDGRSTMTMQIWMFDSHLQEARYVNCGHNAAFVTQVPSRSSQLSEFEVRGALNASDLLGMHPQAEFTEQKFSYSILRRVFLYTDGLIECKARDGSVLRVKQVKKMLEESSTTDFKTAALKFVSSVGERFNGLDLEDDITLVFIDVTRHGIDASSDGTKRSGTGRTIGDSESAAKKDNVIGAGQGDSSQGHLPPGASAETGSAGPFGVPENDAGSGAAPAEDARKWAS